MTQFSDLEDRINKALFGFHQRLEALEKKTYGTGFASPEASPDPLYPREVAAIYGKVPRTEMLYAPLRSKGNVRTILDLTEFANRLLDMGDLGCYVPSNVREEAKTALGLAN